MRGRVAVEPSEHCKCNVSLLLLLLQLSNIDDEHYNFYSYSDFLAFSTLDGYLVLFLCHKTKEPFLFFIFSSA